MKKACSNSKFKCCWKVKLVWILITSLIGLGTYFFLYHFKRTQYNETVLNLSEIIEKIDSSCKIMCFAEDMNAIDFLNIKEFAGDHVGSMKVNAPQQWKGPYAEEISLYNGKPFNIFVHATGAYIVPGVGTILDDGKIIGKDIVFDENFDMENFCKTFDSLCPKGKRLIKKLKIDVKNMNCDKKE